MEPKKGAALKNDQEKPPLHLIPRKPLADVAMVLNHGAEKYDTYNWRKGMAWSRLYGAALRHVMAALDGEDQDPETGLPHEAHAVCCLLFLLQYRRDFPEMDDRYNPEPAPQPEVREVIRDCSTCRFHKQGDPFISNVCKACLDWPDLPMWEPDPDLI